MNLRLTIVFFIFYLKQEIKLQSSKFLTSYLSFKETDNGNFENQQYVIKRFEFYANLVTTISLVNFPHAL